MSALTRSKGADPPFFSLHWAIVINRFNVKEFDKVSAGEFKPGQIPMFQVTYVSL